MTSTQDLLALIATARQRGADVVVTMDADALAAEGREIISSVQVSGLLGCGPHPMCAISAAERLRECLAGG